MQSCMMRTFLGNDENVTLSVVSCDLFVGSIEVVVICWLMALYSLCSQLLSNQLNSFGKVHSEARHGEK